MINLNLVHIVKELNLIEKEVLTHLPYLHGHFLINTDSHEVIPFKWTPTYILNIVLLV